MARSLSNRFEVWSTIPDDTGVDRLTFVLSNPPIETRAEVLILSVAAWNLSSLGFASLIITPAPGRYLADMHYSRGTAAHQNIPPRFQGDVVSRYNGSET
ncbi:0ce7a0b6-3c07-4666-a79e-052e6ee01feb [Thermothielavioides terrestris]|uniref:0ce7a0b6-3c07-4666-a79e-052e6ee01feb n=1 Tax=Thermothielavioides terrestris TaxID=2587410 RepID=A0A446BQ59_9PEZI|nr:0ce7a0b6-3c07-4666-a79e-052e6ee01feb [Thermothielavioides terrestris]